MKILDTDFINIENEYLNDQGIFSDDSPIIIIFKELPLEDRRLLILYAELSSLRKVAKIYNCSHKLIHKRINKIKKHFIQRLNQTKCKNSHSTYSK